MVKFLCKNCMCESLQWLLNAVDVGRLRTCVWYCSRLLDYSTKYFSLLHLQSGCWVGMGWFAFFHFAVQPTQDDTGESTDIM